MFYDLFKCILTDNGSEFSNPEYIEDNGSEVLRTHVFYCDPKQSQQKGKIEVCHEFIRRYIPKGNSFADVGTTVLPSTVQIIALAIPALINFFFISISPPFYVI